MLGIIDRPGGKGQTDISLLKAWASGFDMFIQFINITPVTNMQRYAEFETLPKH